MNKMVFVFLPVTLCVWLPSPTTPPSSQVKPLRGPLSSQNPDLLFFFLFFKPWATFNREEISCTASTCLFGIYCCLSLEF